MDSSAGRGTVGHSEKPDKLYAYLRRENVSFIEPQMWPPSSPDIRVDYVVWVALQQQAYHYCRSPETGHCGRMEQVVAALH